MLLKIFLVLLLVSGVSSRGGKVALEVYAEADGVDNYDIGARVNLRDMEVDFQLVQVIEVPQDFIDKAENGQIDFKSNSDLAALVSQESTIASQATDFLIIPNQADTYPFILLNESLSGKNLTVYPQRSGPNLPQPYFFFRYAQPDRDILIALKNPLSFGYGPGGRRNKPVPSFLCHQGVNKLELALEWSPIVVGGGGIIIHFDVDYHLEIAQNLFRTRDIPHIEVNELFSESGKFEGVEVTVKKGGKYKIRFPDFPVLVLNGTSTNPPLPDDALTPRDDVDINFDLYTGPQQSSKSSTTIKGVIPLYLVISATNTTTEEPVSLAGRIVIDPVVEAESSASSLASWVSYFI
jgi:hypothetical protein